MSEETKVRSVLDMTDDELIEPTKILSCDLHSYSEIQLYVLTLLLLNENFQVLYDTIRDDYPETSKLYEVILDPDSEEAITLFISMFTTVLSSLWFRNMEKTVKDIPVLTILTESDHDSNESVYH